MARVVAQLCLGVRDAGRERVGALLFRNFGVLETAAKILRREEKILREGRTRRPPEKFVSQSAGLVFYHIIEGLHALFLVGSQCTIFGLCVVV